MESTANRAGQHSRTCLSDEQKDRLIQVLKDLLLERSEDGLNVDNSAGKVRATMLRPMCHVRSPSGQCLNLPPSPSNYGAGTNASGSVVFPLPVINAPDIGEDRTVLSESGTLVDRNVCFDANDEHENNDTPISRLRAYKNFRQNWFNLNTKLIELEYSVRSLGGAGPFMDAARDLRKSLEKVIVLYNKSVRSYCPGNDIRRIEFADVPQDFGGNILDYAEALGEVSAACCKASGAFESIIHMYYNAHLSNLLEAMKVKYKTVSGLHKDARMQPTAMHDDMVALSAEMNSLSVECSKFIEAGIPMIRTAQANVTAKFLTMSTIATFFSSVTATMIQFSYQMTSTRISVAVNTFWFLSLVFSIASAAHGLLVMSWRQSYIRPPDVYLPNWAKFWLAKGALVHLTLSGMFFGIGLCLFMKSSNQGKATLFAISIAGGLHTVVLVILCIWFVLEQWRFRETTSRIGLKLTKDSLLMTILTWIVPSRNNPSLHSRPTMRTHAGDSTGHSGVLPNMDEPTNNSFSHSLKEILTPMCVDEAAQPLMPRMDAADMPQGLMLVLTNPLTSMPTANSQQTTQRSSNTDTGTNGINSQVSPALNAHGGLPINSAVASSMV